MGTGSFPRTFDDPEGATINELAALKMPVGLRPRAGEVIEITDAFCAEHLDGELCPLVPCTPAGPGRPERSRTPL
jgi:hypothetical protein